MFASIESSNLEIWSSLISENKYLLIDVYNFYDLDVSLLTYMIGLCVVALLKHVNTVFRKYFNDQ